MNSLELMVEKRLLCALPDTIIENSQARAHKFTLFLLSFYSVFSFNNIPNIFFYSQDNFLHSPYTFPS
jgi:hypothetical protein